MKTIYNDDYHKKCREYSKKNYCPKKKRIYHIMKKYKFDKSILENLSIDEQLILLEKKIFESKFNLKL
jgi:hypothetical protein